MIKISIAFLLTILGSVSQADNYSVCENCVLADANADYFSSTYPGDYLGFSRASYFKPEVSDTKTGQIISLTLQKYECLESPQCKKNDLTEDAEVTIYAGSDPLKTYNKDAAYKPIYVHAKIKLAGESWDTDCTLGQTLDTQGKYGYSYEHGVTVNCIIGLEHQTAMSFNLYFKRTK